MPVMAHTRIKKNFSSILDSDEEWQRVCRALVRARNRPRSSGIGRAAATRPASGLAGPPPWYLAKWWMVTWFLGWAMLVFYFVTPVLDTGRDRFWSVCLSVALVIVGGFGARQGPEHLHMPRLLLWLLRSSQQPLFRCQVTATQVTTTVWMALRPLSSRRRRLNLRRWPQLLQRCDDCSMS